MSDMAERLCAAREFAENAYLNYSMYVIKDGAFAVYYAMVTRKPVSVASFTRCLSWG